MGSTSVTTETAIWSPPSGADVSYKLPPQIARAVAPDVNDDSAAGFVVGSVIINTSVTPRTAYVCTDDTAGAAEWELIGSPTSHPAYLLLDWVGSGHDGGALSVAGFTTAGAAQTIQSSDDGQFVQRVSGNLVFTSFAGTILIGPNEDNGYNAAYAANDTTTTYAGGAAVWPIGNL